MDFEEMEKKLNQKWQELEDSQLTEIQHQKGKLTARERISLLLDEGSFFELDPFVETRFSKFGLEKKKFPGDAVITGFGKVNGRQVYLYSQDFRKLGGTLGELHSQKIVKIYELALKTGKPVIGIIDSGGARIQEGVAALEGYGALFQRMIKASGVIPQITIIVGPSAGGASYSPGLSDFVLMVKKIGQMYITGPEVIKSVTGEEVSMEELGGAEIHNQKSGSAHFLFEKEEDCFLGARKLLSFLPQNNLEEPPSKKTIWGELFEREEIPKISKIVPREEEKTYDMKEVIKLIFDRDSFFEIQEHFAKNCIIGFALLGGYVVGVVANQPKFLAGVLDIDSSDKIARFVNFCDCFNIPLINLVDVPGYLPGVSQEHGGIIRHGAKVLFAFSQATVPKISLILRKAFGGAYIALCSRALGFDRVLAWPGAQIGVMGAEGAVKIIFKKEILASKEPKKLIEEKIKEYQKFLSVFEGAKMGQVDLIVEPKDTRKVLIESLISLKEKREAKVSRKHGNIPL